MNYAFVYRVGVVPGIRYGNNMEAYAARARQALLSGAVTGFSAAMGYDWLYDVLTPADRATEVASLASLTPPKSLTNPLDDGEILERSGYVVTGLAFWGDGVRRRGSRHHGRRLPASCRQRPGLPQHHRG